MLEQILEPSICRYIDHLQHRASVNANPAAESRAEIIASCMDKWERGLKFLDCEITAVEMLDCAALSALRGNPVTDVIELTEFDFNGVSMIVPIYITLINEVRAS